MDEQLEVPEWYDETADAEALASLIASYYNVDVAEAEKLHERYKEYLLIANN